MSIAEQPSNSQENGRSALDQIPGLRGHPQAGTCGQTKYPASIPFGWNSRQ
jgi:hypothetical protein